MTDPAAGFLRILFPLPPSANPNIFPTDERREDFFLVEEEEDGRRELGREGGRGRRGTLLSTSTGDSESRDDRLLIPSKIVPSLLRREEKVGSSGRRNKGDCRRETSSLVRTVSGDLACGEESADRKDAVVLGLENESRNSFKT